jgi:hypothetical protein
MYMSNPPMVGDHRVADWGRESLGQKLYLAQTQGSYTTG